MQTGVYVSESRGLSLFNCFPMKRTGLFDAEPHQRAEACSRRGNPYAYTVNNS